MGFGSGLVGSLEGKVGELPHRARLEFSTL